MRADLRLFWLVLAVLAQIMGFGCAAERKPIVYIPIRCLHAINVTDFADKCTETFGKPGEADCNKVHIKYSCIEFGKQ